MIVSTREEDKRMDTFVGCVIGRMAEFHLSNEDMAKLIGVNERTFERKLKDPSRFKLDEIIKISKKLKLDDHDISRCFCFIRR